MLHSNQIGWLQCTLSISNTMATITINTKYIIMVVLTLILVVVLIYYGIQFQSYLLQSHDIAVQECIKYNSIHNGTYCVT